MANKVSSQIANLSTQLGAMPIEITSLTIQNKLKHIQFNQEALSSLFATTPCTQSSPQVQ